MNSKPIDYIALTIAIVGTLNWGLIGFLNFNLVHFRSFRLISFKHIWKNQGSWRRYVAIRRGVFFLPSPTKRLPAYDM